MTKNQMRQKLKGQPSFWFCPIPKIKNSEILESLLLLQILAEVLA